MEKILALQEAIGKFFSKHLDFLTSVPQRRIQEVIVTCLYSVGQVYRGKKI